jgi:hypothetical protein
MSTTLFQVERTNEHQNHERDEQHAIGRSQANHVELEEHQSMLSDVSTATLAKLGSLRLGTFPLDYGSRDLELSSGGMGCDGSLSLLCAFYSV